MQRLHARYPFLDAAREAVEDADVDLVDLIREGDSAVVDRALDRVQSALADGTVGEPHRSHRVELLSYPVARVLVSLVNEPVLTETYARAEAADAHERYLADFDSTTQLKSTSGERLTLDRLLREFDLDAAVRAVGDDEYRIAVGRYLELANDRSSEAWRLTNRALADGEVPIDREELLALCRGAVIRRIQDGLPLSVPDAIADELDPQVRAIRETLADLDLTDDIDAVVPELFPPSVARLVERARDGEDLSAHARFTLLSFLVSIGLDAEDVQAFCGFEGREAAAARQQLRHLVLDDGPAAYPPPTYETMAASGVDVTDEERASTAAHPLTFYETRLEAEESYEDWRDREREA